MSQVVDVTALSASDLINPPEPCCNYLKIHQLEFVLISQHLHMQASPPQPGENPGQLVLEGFVGVWTLERSLACGILLPSHGHADLLRLPW